MCDFAQRAPFRVRIFDAPQNLGVIKNFERCIALCEGDAIAPCDQDDIWLPQKLERCLEILQSSQSIGLVFSDAQLMSESGEALPQRLWEAIFFDEKARQNFSRDAFAHLLRGNVVTGTALMFRAQFKEQCLPIPPDVPVLHDAWIALVVAAQSDVRFIEEPLLCYRQHAAQHTRERDDKIERVKSVAHYRQHLNLLENLMSRVENMDAEKQQIVADNKAHLQARLQLSSSPFGRTMRVLDEMAKGRYGRYSSGWRSALRDLIYGTSR